MTTSSATAGGSPPVATIVRGRSLLARAVIGIVLLALIAGGGAWLMHASIDPREEAIADRHTDTRALLDQARSWGYQLQGLDLQRVARSQHDLVVVDETLDGQRRGEAAQRAVQSLKRKPDGGRRLVLSYISIGEAEAYRPYWRQTWAEAKPLAIPAANPGAEKVASAATITGSTGSTATEAQPKPRLISPTWRPALAPTAAAPSWLGPENAEWSGNFRVRYWQPEWQKVVFGAPDALVDRIIAAGFDGLYIDRADVYVLWKSERPTAKADMIAFLERISAYAREKKPGFLIVLQNAEELLTNSKVRAALDGVAKEDLFFGIEGDGRENTPDNVKASLDYLKLARKDGLPVLVVEYLADRDAALRVRQRIEREGLVPNIAPRLLNALTEPS